MDEREEREAKQTLLKAVLELETKGLNYLLVANGAGLAACLATLKDYAAVPQLHGMGNVVALFSAGLLSGGVAFFCFQLGSFELMRAVTNGGDKPWYGRILMSIMNSMMVLSGTLFGWAILLIGKKFASL